MAAATVVVLGATGGQRPGPRSVSAQECSEVAAAPVTAVAPSQPATSAVAAAVQMPSTGNAGLLAAAFDGGVSPLQERASPSPAPPATEAPPPAATATPLPTATRPDGPLPGPGTGGGGEFTLPEGGFY